MNTTKKMRGILLAAVAGLTLSVAACGSDTATDTASSGASSAAAETTTEATTEPAETSDAGTTGGEFGEGCAAVPASGPGSFEGMSTDPVATAASTNPVLETLVTAVGAADLATTLDGLAEATVFAPANSAFEAIAPADLTALLADVPALTDVLTYHVLPMRLSPDELAGTYTTVQGGELTIEGSGEDFTVGEGAANVVCGNVQTANATVYIIDAVLSPPAA